MPDNSKIDLIIEFAEKMKGAMERSEIDKEIHNALKGKTQVDLILEFAQQTDASLGLANMIKVDTIRAFLEENEWNLDKAIPLYESYYAEHKQKALYKIRENMWDNTPWEPQI